MQRVQLLLVVVIAALCGNLAVAQNMCFPNGDDCASGGTDPALTTYAACCQPLLDDNTVRRSFVSNGRCFECIQIGLDQAQYTFNENNTVYTSRLRLLAPTGYTGFARPRLRLNGIPGTASVNDFSLVTSDILLRDPVVGIDIAITISVDGIAGEPPEMFTISYQPPGVSGNADPLFLFRNTTVTIIDTDKPTYQFDQGDYVESEGTGRPIVVNVQQIVPSVQDIHLLLVPLTYAQYSARAATDPTLANITVYHGSRPDPAEHDVRQDFDMTVRPLFFPAGSNIPSQMVSFPIFDDAINELPEGFIIVLYRDNQTTIDVAFTPNLRTTLGRINDNDPFFFGFVLNEVTYNEARNEGLQELLYSPAPRNKTEVSFVFSLNLNALQGGFEFGAGGDISFGAAVIRPTFTFDPDDAPEDRIVTFSVIRDNIVEGQEIGQLQIARSTFFDGFTPLFQNVRIIINDSNTATFNLSAPPVVTEGKNLTFDAMVFLTAPSGGTTFQIEIVIMELGITATQFGQFADFRRNAAPSVIFQGTERPGCCVEPVEYLVRDDNIAEPDEVFTISIARSITSAAIPVDFVVQQVNVTIIDNDMATIGFENVTFSVAEGAGFVVLPVAVLGTTTLGGEVTVRFNTADLTAIAGSDYTATTRLLTFSPTTRRILVQVPITQDGITELTEQFNATLTLINDGGIDVNVEPDQATVEIIDDDGLVIGFVETAVSVAEGAGNAVLMVRANHDIDVEVTVRLTTADQSAIAGSDYAGQNRILTFGGESGRTVTVNVPITQDSLAELDETFRAILTLVNGNGRTVSINPPVAIVTIDDDDSAVVRFVRDSYTFSEADGTGIVQVQLVGSISTTRDVTINQMVGGATTVRTVRFLPNIVNQVVNIPIAITNNNVALENNITIMMTVATPPPSLITIGTPDTATVTIVDDDTVTVGYQQSAYQFSEADGSGTIMVAISNPIANPFSITAFGAPGVQTFVTISGTPVNQVLTFTPSSPMVMNINMPIINDEIGLEPDEVFPLRFINADSRVTVGGGSLSSDTRITIVDDDGVVISMVTPSITVSEDVGFVEVCFSLSRQSAVPIDVRVDGRDGTAIENVDFMEVQTQVRVTPPNRQGCVNYTLVQDGTAEPTETFTSNIVSAVTQGRRNPTVGLVTTNIIITDPTPTESVCTLSAGRITAFANDNEGVAYNFNRPCEHALLTTCTLRVPSDFGVFVDSTNGMNFVVGVRLNGTTTIVNQRLVISSLGVIVERNEPEEGNTTVRVRVAADSPLRDECGLCGERGGTLELPNGVDVNSTIPGDLEEFITAYRVMPGDTFVMEPRRSCGILANDTVEGDPTFTVPLLTNSNEDHTLCYEIHGEAGRYFNLVSDRCVSTNAHFVERPNPRPGGRRPLNIIDQIAVRAANSLGQCVNIAVDLNANGTCVTTVGGTRVATNAMVSSNRISVRAYSNMVRISVPNCENVRLVMRVYCEVQNGVDMIRYRINRGYNLRPSSHGLLAQFWNVPASVQRYTGTLRDGSTRNDVYIITLRPPNAPVRQVPAFLSSIQWDLTPKDCLYAGNAQGGPIYEVPTPNDPLIQGRYQHYLTASSYETNFQYEQFDENSCSGIPTRAP